MGLLHMFATAFLLLQVVAVNPGPACEAEEVAAAERFDDKWLVDHFVTHHGVVQSEASEFVRAYLGERAMLRDVGNAAKATAAADVAAGECYYFTYGLTRNSSERNANLQEGGIQPIYGGSCLLFPAEYTFITEYNREMSHQLSLQGTDVNALLRSAKPVGPAD